MKTVPVTFGEIENGLHMRPAVLVVKLASLFAGNELRLHRHRSGDGDQADLKSIVGIAAAGIQARDNWWLTVTGEHAAIVAMLVQAFLNNLHLAQPLYAENKGTPNSRSAGPELLLEEMAGCLQKFSSNSKEKLYGEQTIGLVEGILRISSRRNISRSEAVLNSPKGLHLACAQILAHAASLYRCDIRLAFINSDGEPESCNAADIFEILSVVVDSGETISIRANGEDSQQAVGVIKRLIENLGEIEEIARRERKCIKTKSELIDFLRDILHLRPGDLGLN